MNRRPSPTFLICGLLGGLLLLDLVLPIASFLLHAEWSRWLAALRQPDAWHALTVSVTTSAVAMLVMTLLGVPLGYLLARADLPFKQLWVSLVFLPMVMPDLAGGLLLMQTFGPYGVVGHPLDARGIELTNNLAGIVLAQLFVASPFVIISALSGFSRVDVTLELAAATLGDSRWQTFWRVSLPLAWPGIAAGITLAWIRALGEFGATLIMAYNPHTLPVYMWVKFESDGLAGALPAALCLLLLAAAAVVASGLLNRLTSRAGVVTPLGNA
jgi:molybdate/tungstate transport system permease protein